MTAPRLFVVGDIAGPDDYHLGDEAMLEANLHALRCRVPDVRFTVPSRDAAWTSARYGVDGIPAPVLPRALVDDPARWNRELAETAAIRRGWLGEAVADALRATDGLVISGGGNLCETWPEKILERVALIAEARAVGLPVVVVGQTIGPGLTIPQRHLLTSTLPWASFVGVRDADSAALARELGVADDRVHVQLDDAFGLAPLAVTDARASALQAAPRPWIVVTLDASFGAAANAAALEAIAAQLDGLAEHLRATLVFSPHVGGATVPPTHDDRVAGARLAAVLRTPLVVLDLWQPAEVRWLIGEAAMVVSARYHPLIFATAARIPALGIYSDDYTRTKLRGALAPAGLDGWCLSKAEAARGDLLPLAAELAHRGADLAHRLAVRAAAAAPEEAARWERILQALRLPAPTAAALSPTVLRVAAPPLPRAALGDLGETAWQQYERQGYLRLGRVLDDAEIRALGTRLDDLMLGRVRYPTLQVQLDTGCAYEDLAAPSAGLATATLDYRKVQGLEVDPLFLALLRRDVFRVVCARQYGPHAAIAIFRAMMMNKPAGQGTHLPWHQDGGGVWKLDRDPLVTTWIAIDPATRANGCLQVIPGSHRLGLLSKQGSTLAPHHVARHCPDTAVEHLELAAGEALVLHNWLVHRSGVNTTDRPRRAFTACYMDARTLGTLTGARYPLLFGEPENIDVALRFRAVLADEGRRLREMRAETERYAHSLEAEVAKMQAAAAAAAATTTPAATRPWWWPRF